MIARGPEAAQTPLEGVRRSDAAPGPPPAAPSDVPALVFGENVTGLGVLRSLGRSGVPAFVTGTRTSMVARSRWFARPPGGPIDEAAGPEQVAAYLRALPFPRAVSFPCSDRWAQTLASLPEDVARAYPAVVTSADVLHQFVDKERFAAVAGRLDVPTPRTLRVTGVEDLAALGDDELPRFFLKPCDSQAFNERYGVKGLRLADRRGAAEHVGRLAAEGLEMLLQEFIPGPPTAHVFLDGYVDRSGVMLACLARRRLRMFPAELGNSTLSVTIPLAEAGGAVDSLRRLFSGLGYTGLFDAEFKYDVRDEEFKIVEVNARPWWQFALTDASGLQLAAMAYEDSLGRRPAPAPDYEVGRTWVHPVPDAKAWWAGRGDAETAGGFPARSWFTGANVLFSWDDPGPAAEEIGGLARGAVLRMLRRLSPFLSPARPRQR